MSNQEYTSRGLPYRVNGQELFWSVGGTFKDESSEAGGVLEWCFNEGDANHLKSLMEKDSRFSNLTVSDIRTEE